VIRINLVPRDEARRQAARQRDRQIAMGIITVLAAIFAAGEFVTRRSARAVHSEAAEFQTELTELTKRYQDTVLLEKKRKELEAKLKTIAILERQRRGPVRVLADLGEATPEKLWLTEMRETGGSMLLTGKGLDNQTIALFMRNLQNSSYFSTVDLVETKQVEDGQAKLKEFSIRTHVLYAGRRPPAEESTANAGKAKGKPKPEGGPEVTS
jgi:type IV pilus assembly protein PilN